MSGPLDGVRVVDCSSSVAGWRTTGLFADYGAEVLWVEPAGGDPLRRYVPASHAVFNRGKRSLVVDVHDAVGRDRVLSLLDGADVFVESWGPGVADALGLGWGAVHARNPRLVYCSISGFGEVVADRDLPGDEGFIHARLGIMTNAAAHRSGPIFPGLAFASIGAAYVAAIATMAAMYRGGEDGVGRRVETSLFDGALAYLSMSWSETDLDPASPLGSQKATTLGTRLLTRSYMCADGEYIGIHTGAVGAFGRLMQVLGLDDRIPPSETGMDIGMPLTPEQARIIDDEVMGILASRPRGYWVQRLLEADVCGIEHLRAMDVFDQEQPRHNEMVLQIDDPVLGPVLQVAPGAKFREVQASVPTPAPILASPADAALAPATASTPSAPVVADQRPLLQGVHILDLGAYYAGPYSSRLLADLGAEVIKVEPPQGDQLRGIDRVFSSAQAGKRSLAANLKDPALSKALERLIGWADIVHHNLRPGAAERLGFGLDDVRRVNPEAIYLYAPGWGSTGPHHARQSFAPMMSGYVGVTFEVAGACNEPMPPIGNEDPGNGLLGAFGMLAALLHRRRTGVAGYVENPQLNATMCHMAHVVRTPDGEVIGGGLLDTLQFGVGPLERLYETSDGWLLLSAPFDHHLVALGGVLGRPIHDDERFATIEARAANGEVLAALLAEAFATRSATAWLADFSAAGVPAMEPSATSAHDFFVDPEQRQLGRVVELDYPKGGKVREIHQLVRITDTEMPPHRLAPGLGEHTDEILTWLGYKPEEIDELRDRGAVRCGPNLGASE